MCIKYWPDWDNGAKQPLSYGGINIRIAKEDQLACFVVRTLMIKPEDGQFVSWLFLKHFLSYFLQHYAYLISFF